MPKNWWWGAIVLAFIGVVIWFEVTYRETVPTGTPGVTRTRSAQQKTSKSKPSQPSSTPSPGIGIG